MLFLLALSSYGQSHKIAKRPAIRYDWRPGMVNIPEISYGFGLSETNVEFSHHYLSVTNVTGYQFSRHAKIGIGYGLQPQNEGFLVPLFVNARVSPSSGAAVPYLEASGGLAVNPESFEANSRIFFAASGGIRYVVAKKRCVNFSVGILSQGGGAEGRSSFFNLKAGIEFKGNEWKL